MKPLWAPWRLEYILSSKPDGCVFCSAVGNAGSLPDSWDREKKVLYRGKFSFVIMNIFPYNNGHLMAVPYRHVSSISDLPEAEYIDLSMSLKKSVSVLKEAFQPDGVNVGMNLGKCAGAGILDHIHWHAVPRWDGDTNFMSVCAETRVIPQHIETAFDILYPLFQK